MKIKEKRIYEHTAYFFLWLISIEFMKYIVLVITSVIGMCFKPSEHAWQYHDQFNDYIEEAIMLNFGMWNIKNCYNNGK